MRTPAEVNAFVFDYLRAGPVCLERFYLDAWSQAGITRIQLSAACQRLGVGATSNRKRDADHIMVRLPAKVVAIWWARCGGAHRFYEAPRAA